MCAVEFPGSSGGIGQGDAVAEHASGQDARRGERGGFHAGQLARVVQNLTDHRRSDGDPRAFQGAFGSQVDCEDAIDAVAQIDGSEVSQTMNEQAGPKEQNHRQGHLDQNQRASHGAVAPRQIGCLQIWAGIHAGGAPCRINSGEENGGQAGRKGKQQDGRTCRHIQDGVILAGVKHSE